MTALDQIVHNSLSQLAADPLVLNWHAKEHDWVSYYTMRYLLAQCDPAGPLREPGQVAIECLVPQLPGRKNRAVLRDIVIWQRAGDTCWDSQWRAVTHPRAILEWKVHRPNRRNRLVAAEREWLREYCIQESSVAAYAIEVEAETGRISMECTRYAGVSSVQILAVSKTHEA